MPNIFACGLALSVLLFLVDAALIYQVAVVVILVPAVADVLRGQRPR